MVYKRYVKVNGKVCGPYYYESYRDKNGKVVSKYLKNYKPHKNKNNNNILLLITLFVLIFLLIFFVVNLEKESQFLDYLATKLTGMAGGFGAMGEATPNQTWNVTGPPGTAYGIAVDASGNVYVTGNSSGDYITIKYDSNGNQVWNATYDSGVGDAAKGIAVDASGNVYVIGYNGTGYSGGGFNSQVIKYDSSGNNILSFPINLGKAYAIDVDNSQNIYTCGGSNGGSNFVAKYNSTGQEKWNVTGVLAEGSYAIAVDASGNVYVTGYVVNSNNDYFTKKFDTNGNQIWNATYDSGDIDSANGIAVDNSGNVYVTGTLLFGSMPNYYTIKYNSSGQALWNTALISGLSYAIAVDSSSNVYVAGYNQNSNYYTIKYNSSGQEIWNVTYDSGGTDTAYGIAVDSSNKTYVTGIANGNYYTIKYNYSVFYDTVYPLFSSYWDNNASLTDSGTGLFNVTVLNTNGTVWLSINGTNYTASNLSLNVYNVSVAGLVSGTYIYNWSAYGNGTDKLFNMSETRSYAVNATDLTQVSNCGILSLANTVYNQITDIINNTLTTPCINITASNITYNCNGHYISSDDPQSGIYARNLINITIKNCVINMGSNENGIIFWNTNFSFILNNTINNSYNAVNIQVGYNNSVINNFLNNTRDTGIYFNGGSSNTISNNSIINSTDVAISLSSRSNFLINNTIRNCGTGISSGGNANILIRNSIENATTGITFTQYFIDIIDNKINNNSIGLLLSGNQINISNNIIKYNNVGIKFITGASYTSNISNNILSENRDGVLFYGFASNHVFSDSNISLNTFNDTFSAGPNLNNTFLNCTYDISKENVKAGGELIRKWHYRIYVNDSNGNYIANANISAYNVSGNNIFNLTTNSTGWTNITGIIEYVNNGGTRNYYSNYTINASNGSYSGGKTFNASLELNKINDFITISPNSLDSTPPLVNITYPLNISYTVNVSQLNYTSNEAGYCWYSNNSGLSNSSAVSAGANFTNVLSVEGGNNWRIYCNDSIGNLNDSMQVSFSIVTSPSPPSPPSSSPPSPGVMVIPGNNVTNITVPANCSYNWKCGDWSFCNKGIQTRKCVNKGNCTGYAGKPEEARLCLDQTEEDEIIERELLERGGNWICGNWSKCNVVYNLDDIINNNIMLYGEQERTCKSEKLQIIQRKKCDTRIPIKTKNVIWCYKDYLEVYDLNDKLISRLELIDGDYKTLNINFEFNQTRYCPYCSDELKDYDEDGIDCVYEENGSCPVCGLVEIQSRNYFIWVFLIILLASLIFLIILIIVGSLFENKDEKEEKPNLHIKGDVSIGDIVDFYK